MNWIQLIILLILIKSEKTVENPAKKEIHNRENQHDG